MTLFLKTIFKYILIVILISLFLDIIYTVIYYNTDGQKKIDWVRDISNQKFDFVVFGSSRVKYHIDINKISQRTDRRGLNLGEADQGLFEILLMIKTFYSNNNSSELILVQIDDNWNNELPNIAASSYFMPFIYEDLYRQEYKNIKGYKEFVYLPFYRFMKNYHTIGFRYAMKRLFFLRSETDKYGFKYLNGSLDSDILIRYKQLAPVKNNEFVNRIIQLTLKNNSKLVFFTAPTLEYSPSDFNYFEKILPNYFNFTSDSIYGIKHFSDEIHLNKEGVDLFMDIFINDIFK